MSKPEVTSKERQESITFWRQHEAALRAQNLCSEDALRWLSIYAQPNNIGYEQGELRPGKLGQWDLYYLAMEFLSPEELLLISGLSAGEVAVADRDARHGLDSSDPDYAQQVADIDRMKAMSPVELDREIARLQALVDG